MVFKEENLDKIAKVKIFISALDDVKEELEILLNTLVDINRQNEILSFDLKYIISGNPYVEAIIKNKNFNLEIFDSMDSFSYGENPATDAFIGILWNKTEDLTNFPKIDSKDDFYNALKFLEIGGILYSSLFFTFKEASLFSSLNVEEIKKIYSFKKKFTSKVFHYEYNDLKTFEDFCQNEILTLNQYFLEKESSVFRDKNDIVKPSSLADSFAHLLKNIENLPDGIESYEDFNIQVLDFDDFDEIREYLTFNSNDSYDNSYDYLLEDENFNKFDYKNKKSYTNNNIIKKIVKEDNNQLYNIISEIRRKIRFPQGNDFILYLINYFEDLDFSLEEDITSLNRFLWKGKYDNFVDFIEDSDSNLEIILDKLNDNLDLWNDEYKEFRQVILKNKDFNWNLILILYYVLLEEESKEEIIPIIKVLIYLKNVIDGFDCNLSFFYSINKEISTSSEDKIKESSNDTRKFINKWRRYLLMLKKDIENIKSLLE